MGYSTVQYYSTVEYHSVVQGGGYQLTRGGRRHCAGWGEAADRGATDRWFLGVFAGIAVANSVFTLARAFSFASGGLCAAHALHGQLIQAVSRASMAFFDRNPTGRLLRQVTPTSCPG